MTPYNLNPDEQKLTLANGSVVIEVEKWGASRQVAADIDITHPTYDDFGGHSTMNIEVPLAALAGLLRSAGWSVTPPSHDAALRQVLVNEAGDPKIAELATLLGRSNSSIRRAINNLAKVGFRNRYEMLLIRTQGPHGSTYSFQHTDLKTTKE